MKNTLKYMIPALVAVACVTAKANVTANFEGSTTNAFDTNVAAGSWNGTLTSPANLDAGTAGGTWSVSSTSTLGNDTLIDVANGAYMAGNQLIMGIRPWNNDLPHSTVATLSFGTAMDLDGLSVSLDAAMLGYGGMPGQTYIDLMSGGSVVARVSTSPDAGNGRGSMNHYSGIEAVDSFATKTALAADYAVWGLDDSTMPVVNIAMTFATADFSLATTGALTSDINATGLSYVNGTPTTIDAIRFSATGSKASMAFDNISVVPEPATLGLVATFGGAVLFIRRWLAI